MRALDYLGHIFLTKLFVHNPRFMFRLIASTVEQLQFLHLFALTLPVTVPRPVVSPSELSGLLQTPHSLSTLWPKDHQMLALRTMRTLKEWLPDKEW